VPLLLSPPENGRARLPPSLQGQGLAGGRDSSVADAARIAYAVHQGTGLERPAYSQAPRRGGERGVCVPNKYHLSRKRLFHGRDLTTAGISLRVVVSADLKCPNSREGFSLQGSVLPVRNNPPRHPSRGGQSVSSFAILIFMHQLRSAWLPVHRFHPG